MSNLAKKSHHEVLADHGLRVTSQRLQVLAAMRGRHRDATAQQLHHELVAGGSTLGLATVYRTLNALADAGVLDRMQHGASTCFRSCQPGHHHHLVCEQCHTVVELHECRVGPWVSSIGAEHGFTSVRHTLELTGLCGTCQPSEN